MTRSVNFDLILIKYSTLSNVASTTVADAWLVGLKAKH